MNKKIQKDAQTVGRTWNLTSSKLKSKQLKRSNHCLPLSSPTSSRDNQLLLSNSLANN